jgi:signal peptidase I
MPGQDLFVIYLIGVLLVFLPSFGLYKLFQQAGVPGWKAFIPFYNGWVIQETAKRPKYWAVLQLVPVVGWFISMGIFIEWVKLFGKFSLLSHALSALVPFVYFPYLANHKDTRYIGPEGAAKYKKTATREWIDAAVFAIVAATLIRSFVFEAYTIPTSSMEKTLLVNDFLFVSKLSYGPRIPNTPLAMPFVHHTMPLLGTKSYVEWIKIPYTRWFSSPVKRNDVVVFNFPAGDTLTKEWDSQQPYYDILRGYGYQAYDELVKQNQIKNPAQLQAEANSLAREAVWRDYHITTRPVDKRENYIKRCVAIPGDSLQLKQGILYINGQPAFVSPSSATFYNVVTNSKLLDEDALREAGIRLNQEDQEPDFQPLAGTGYKINLTLGEVDILKKIPRVSSVTREISDKIGETYPYDTSLFKWTADNFGPLWVPKKGATIPLTPQNIDLYKRVIRVYENNKWEEKEGKIYINGQAADSYTFKMNYYWMMGDNRHKSQDSRYWGFVPEDHVVGEAWLIWMSWEHGVRWNRLFQRIR